MAVIHPEKHVPIFAALGIALLCSCSDSPSVATNPTSPAIAVSSATSAAPYSVVQKAQFAGVGRIDYVYADSAERRLYVPRGMNVLVFDLDTLKQLSSISDARGVHGVAVDPKYHTGFCSSNPVVMWDTQTLATIKTIPVEGSPDGILFEPFTDTIYVLSHEQPNVTVINAKDGSIAGTIDLGGAPEQGQSDGLGHVYIDLEDKNSIAVVDSASRTVTGHFDLGGMGKEPAGLGLDAKNHILFAMCRNPATCVVLSSTSGGIITSLPIGEISDGGGFIPDTMEAFSSQRDGTLTIIKENSPTSFAVEQTVSTIAGAKTSTLDTKTNRLVLIATEPLPLPAATDLSPTAEPPVPITVGAQGQRGGRGGAGNGGPTLLDILVVGR